MHLFLSLCLSVSVSARVRSGGTKPRSTLGFGCADNQVMWRDALQPLWFRRMQEVDLSKEAFVFESKREEVCSIKGVQRSRERERERSRERESVCVCVVLRCQFLSRVIAWLQEWVASVARCLGPKGYVKVRCMQGCLMHTEAPRHTHRNTHTHTHTHTHRDSTCRASPDELSLASS